MRRRRPPMLAGSRSTRSITARWDHGAAPSAATAAGRAASATNATPIAHVADLMFGRKIALLRQAEPVEHRRVGQQIHLGGDRAVGPVVDDQGQAVIVEG